MDALDFLREANRMCKTFKNCDDCPMMNPKFGSCYDFTNCSDSKERERVVKIVEEWSKSHPRKTRQSEFLKMFPHAKMLSTGLLVCNPCEVDYRYSTTDCCDNCLTCREKYWLQEVE